MKLFRVFLLAAVPALLLAAPALEAQPAPPPGFNQAPPKTKRVQRPQQKKKQLDRSGQLDGLFAALKAAPNAQIAKQIEQRLEATLATTESDTLNLLMVRARTTMQTKELDTALELLNAMIEIDPRYTEAWAQRATLYFVKKDYYRSLADLRVVLAQEPRHYAAMAGLGVIMQDLGEDRRALDAFRRALEIHPHLENIPELVKRLRVKVEGREI
jgi:Tfp pilus assembly protein PilF